MGPELVKKNNIWTVGIFTQISKSVSKIIKEHFNNRGKEPSDCAKRQPSIVALQRPTGSRISRLMDSQARTTGDDTRHNDIYIF